jgi:hypothetical protein
MKPEPDYSDYFQNWKAQKRKQFQNMSAGPETQTVQVLQEYKATCLSMHVEK